MPTSPELWGDGEGAPSHAPGSIPKGPCTFARARARVRVGVRVRVRASLKVLTLSSCSPRALASRLLRCCSQNFTLPCPRTHGHPACSPLGRPGASRCPAKQMASPGDAQRRSGDLSWLRVKGVSPLTWHAAYTKQKRPLCVYAPHRKIKSYLLHCK